MRPVSSGTCLMKPVISGNYKYIDQLSVIADETSALLHKDAVFIECMSVFHAYQSYFLFPSTLLALTSCCSPG